LRERRDLLLLKTGLIDKIIRDLRRQEGEGSVPSRLSIKGGRNGQGGLSLDGVERRQPSAAVSGDKAGGLQKSARRGSEIESQSSTSSVETARGSLYKV